MGRRSVTVKARHDLKGQTSEIAEVAAPNGEGLLVEFRTSPGGSGLAIIPYRADSGVRLMVRSHSADCSCEPRAFDYLACDCGACLRFVEGAWIPTTKGT